MAVFFHDFILINRLSQVKISISISAREFRGISREFREIVGDIPHIGLKSTGTKELG